MSSERFSAAWSNAKKLQAPTKSSVNSKPSDMSREKWVCDLIMRKMALLSDKTLFYELFDAPGQPKDSRHMRFTLTGVEKYAIVTHLQKWIDICIWKHVMHRWRHCLEFPLRTKCYSALLGWFSLRRKGIKVFPKDLVELIGKYIWATRNQWQN